MKSSDSPMSSYNHVSVTHTTSGISICHKMNAVHQAWDINFLHYRIWKCLSGRTPHMTCFSVNFMVNHKKGLILCCVVSPLLDSGANLWQCSNLQDVGLCKPAPLASTTMYFIHNLLQNTLFHPAVPHMVTYEESIHKVGILVHEYKWSVM